MAVDDDDRVVSFREKPEHPEGIPGDPEHALASMGVYVFSLKLLSTLLRADYATGSTHDFGTDILPSMVEHHRVGAYRFGGNAGRVTADHYWRDVGTIDAYYEANMDLLKPVPPLDLYQRDWAIRTYHGQNPPARMVPGEGGKDGLLTNSIVGAGTVIIGGIVRHSNLASRVHIHEDAVVEDSILFDHVSVGRGAKLRRCIVDKDVHIPPGETIGYDPEKDSRFTRSEKGIIVVPKEYRFE